jgi:hypothetical protein
VPACPSGRDSLKEGKALGSEEGKGLGRGQVHLINI